MGPDRKPRPAYVEDEDEDGREIRGSKRSASTKEKPKVSQRESRPSKPSRKSHSDTGLGEKGSGDPRGAQIMTEKEAKMERRKSVSGNTSSPRKSGRPPSSHENRPATKLAIPHKPKREDPSHYGITTPTSRAPPVVSQPIPVRPRAVTNQTYPVRPQSFHQAYTSNGGHGPPLSMSAFYAQQPVIPPSYPPPSPSSSYMRYAATPQPTAPQGDYFANHITAPPVRPLSARFDMVPRTAQMTLDPIARTTSAYGVRDTRRQSISDTTYDGGYYEDSYTSRVSGNSGTINRRASIRGPTLPPPRDDPDYVAMPPPPRPGPGPSILRRTTNDYSAEQVDNRVDYRERERELERDTRRYRDESSPRRPSTNRNSVSYDLGKDSERVRVETANNGRRRQSYYGQSTSASGSSGYDDKLQETIHQATNYQEDVGASLPLTAEVLRRQQRRQAGSSRSTKSSGSRDDSDYKKSATTRTTRSGSGNDDENVTIKVTGQARVMVGGAQIDCNEGGEIQISRQKSIRNGSEFSNSEYGGQSRMIDDRRSRLDRPSGRSRISSQHSHHRAPPQYPMGNVI